MGFGVYKQKDNDFFVSPSSQDRQKKKQNSRETCMELSKRTVDGDTAEIAGEIADEVQVCVKALSSAQRSRMFMSFVDIDEPYKYALISSCHDPVPHISPFYPAPMYHLDQDQTMPRIGGCFVSALRGLLCVRLLRSVRICNLTTMQRVTLPIITSTIVPENNENIWSFFGHDPIHDEYKVLSTVGR
ncbi:unnamed protein product [Eruca vesicaria subsp. sativa]|uniref:F-box associated beta-propeller type 3 domain-containing protein n=1 Tax=Eruca vesicaria subsp. sativa TaxID=29727 RepID=A0ABC8LM15_ERUVS|nr:unnamed protein product [Eruca vesicaria subsp. sativa]